jgi:hypothetical protein
MQPTVPSRNVQHRSTGTTRDLRQVDSAASGGSKLNPWSGGAFCPVDRPGRGTVGQAGWWLSLLKSPFDTVNRVVSGDFLDVL